MKKHYYSLFFLIILISGCEKKSAISILLRDYHESYQNNDYDQFISTMHPDFESEYQATKLLFDLTSKYDSVPKFSFVDIEVLYEFKDSVSNGDQYLIAVYSVEKKMSFDKNSDLDITYNILNRDNGELRVLKKSIKPNFEEKKINFKTYTEALLLKRKGENKFFLLPEYSPEYLQKTFGLEEGKMIQIIFDSEFKYVIKPSVLDKL